MNKFHKLHHKCTPIQLSEVILFEDISDIGSEPKSWKPFENTGQIKMHFRDVGLRNSFKKLTGEIHEDTIPLR